MDRVENDIQFNQSIFKRLKKGFWCKTESASRPFIRFTKYRPDAWHLAKSLMVIFICLAIIFYKPLFPIIDFCIFGICWNIFFNLGYNKIFKA